MNQYLILDSRKAKHVNFYIAKSHRDFVLQLVTPKEFDWKIGTLVDVTEFTSETANLKDTRLTVHDVEIHVKKADTITEPEVEHVHHNIFLKNQVLKRKATFLNRLNQIFFGKWYDWVIPITTPKLLHTASEGGSDVFEVDYYGKKAYLAQSPQLYKQILASTLFPKGVYEVGAAYRAEKSHTSQHLSEFTSIDFESSFPDASEESLDNLINVATSIISCLTLEDEDLDVKTVDLLELNLEDLTKQQERDLCEGFDGLVVVKHYANHNRAFYTEGLQSFDILWKGVEIVSGSIRKHKYQDYIDELNRRGMSTDGLEDYLTVFKEGCFRTGGFAIGLERLLMVDLGLSSVKEVLI